ncbi:MAG: hypothetical protein GKC53_05145 [Neisseriaceae bacterium]|nr:MAG: hypothetical protein GKC53_05145 [Neisseriaceae bacterium]
MRRDDFNNNNDYLNPDVEKKYPLDVETGDSSFQKEPITAEEKQLTRAEKRKLEKTEEEQQDVLAKQKKFRQQQAILKEERRIKKQKEKEAKKQKKVEKRKSPVPIYKWIFVIVLLFIPIINIFFIIYWGFFSDWVNKNIRNYVLSILILFIIIVPLSIIGYINSDRIDPQLLQILTNFFDAMYDLSNELFRQLRQLFSQINTIKQSH